VRSMPRRTLKTLKTPNRSGYEGFEGDRAVRQRSPSAGSPGGGR
jgi:hypothetical protein